MLGDATITEQKTFDPALVNDFYQTIIKNMKDATYRPMGLSEGPEGSLYISDSKKGKIWRGSFGKARPAPTKGYTPDPNAPVKEKKVTETVETTTEE